MILGVICEQSMMLKAIIEIVKPVGVEGSLDVEISGVAYDSRQVKPGMLFVAIKGEKCDGNLFVDEAIERGAVAVVSERKELGRRDASHIHVHSARQALAEIAAIFYNHPSRRLDTVGITGTNGKTTIAYMLRDILDRAGRRPGLISTVSYDMGMRSLPAARTTPESLDLQSMLAKMIEADCQSAVMEVSSHALVQKRVWGVDFNVGVFTNLSQDHLDYHESMEQYFSAKSLLFNGSQNMGKSMDAVINIDDEWGRRLSQAGGRWKQVLTYGESSDACVRGENVRQREGGSDFGLVTADTRAEIELNMIGRFNVSNALAAIAAALALGIDIETIAAALRDFKSAPGRLEEVPNQRGLRIFIDYAHTDQALRSVLETLRQAARKRLICVFGCGGDRDQDKRKLMGAVAARHADFSVITSDNPRKEDPRAIIRQIEQGFSADKHYRVVEDREQAIAAALDEAEEGDLVLIAGKGHEAYQEFADTIVPFDDCEVVRSLLDEEK